MARQDYPSVAVVPCATARDHGRAWPAPRTLCPATFGQARPAVRQAAAHTVALLQQPPAEAMLLAPLQPVWQIVQASCGGGWQVEGGSRAGRRAEEEAREEFLQKLHVNACRERVVTGIAVRTYCGSGWQSRCSSNGRAAAVAAGCGAWLVQRTADAAACACLPDGASSVAAHGCGGRRWILGQQVRSSSCALTRLHALSSESGGVLNVCCGRSLAILTDAAHLLSDVSGFAVAIFAGVVAAKKSSSTHTFGCGLRPAGVSQGLCKPQSGAPASLQAGRSAC